MKKSKLLVMMAAVTLLTCIIFAQTSFAATKSELLEEAKKSPLFKYVEVQIENIARSVEITEEQGDQLMAVLNEVKEAVPADLGAYASNYTKEQKAAILDAVADACDVMGFTYKIESKTLNSNYAGDAVLKIYNQEGKIIAEYDGPVKDTSGDSVEYGMVFLISGIAVMAVAAGVLFYNRKKLFNI